MGQTKWIRQKIKEKNKNKNKETKETELYEGTT